MTPHPTPPRDPHDPRWPRASDWLAAAPDGPLLDLAFLGVPAHRTSLSPTGADTHARRRPRRAGALLDLRRLARRGPVRAGRRWTAATSPTRTRTRRRPSAAVTAAAEGAGLLVACGGDNSITYAVARGVFGDRLRSAGLVTLDAHHDLRDGREQRLAGPPPRRGRPRPDAGSSRSGIARLRELPVLRRGGHAPRASRSSTGARSHRRGLADCMREALDVAGSGGGDGLRRPRRRRLRPLGGARRARRACRAGCRPRELRDAAYLAGRDPRVRAVDIAEVDADGGRARRAHGPARRALRARSGGRSGGPRLSPVGCPACAPWSSPATPLTVEDVVDVARGEARAELGPDVAARMEPSRARRRPTPSSRARSMYGVTTGFGALADTHVGRDDLDAHAARAGAVARRRRRRRRCPTTSSAACCCCAPAPWPPGYSGVRVELPRRLLELLDRGLLPVIPGKGSVGASGDLAQLAHLALPLVGEGRLRRAGDPLDGQPGRRAAGRGGPGAADAGRQGGPVPDQRHRADAGAARASRSTRPSCWSRSPTSPAR